MSFLLCREVDLPPDPAAIYEKLACPGRCSFLLESALPGKLGRYSFMGTDPFLVLKSRGRNCTIASKSRSRSFFQDPFLVLEKLMQRYRLPRPQDAPVPFWGGAVGYFAYDLGRLLEEIPAQAEDDLGLPEMYMGFYDPVLAIDHFSGQVYICATGVPGRGKNRYKLAEKRIAAMQRKLGGLKLDHAGGYRDVPNNLNQVADVDLSRAFAHFSRQTYMEAVSRAIEYIRSGDIFQVNLSQRFTVPQKDSPWDIYRRLRNLNPAPFAAYLTMPELAVVSASPERFLKLTDMEVETRPIKGTRPRGSDGETDRMMKNELWNSAKDRAELTMIVDLERNDLGRVCSTGSVQVPEMFNLEAYPTVFHLVSTITGRLSPGREAADLLKASFPGGSITGAPKIRAMQIIEELEPVRRGIYTGALGWLNWSGDMDLSIVIRTLVICKNNIYIQAGGGITTESDPGSEFEETLDKARALLKASL